MLLLVLLGLTQNGVTQICDPPEPTLHRVTFVKGLDTVSDEHTTYWSNGKIKTKTIRLTDSTMEREEYYELTGGLKLKTALQRVWSVDTVYTVSPISNQDTMIEYSGFFYTPHGIYMEYFDYGDQKVRSKGIMKRGYPSGEWLIYKPNGETVNATFQSGWLNGSYRETYALDKTFDFSEWDTIIKCQGNFGIVMQFDTVKNTMYIQEGEPATVIRQKKSAPVGEWNFFDLNGNLIQTLTYDWLKD